MNKYDTTLSVFAEYCKKFPDPIDDERLSITLWLLRRSEEAPVIPDKS